MPFENDEWYQEHVAELLDLHFNCDQKQALDDAFYMICSEIPRISVKERKRKVADDAGQEPSQKRAELDPCEPPIISGWYNNKNRELESRPNGEHCQNEREEREARVRQQVEAQRQVGST